jgi:hypothetical protein
MIVALLVMVAIVIDLGQLRYNRQDDQRVADIAATAAGARLVSAGVSASGGFDPVQGCFAAFDYIKQNAPGFPSGASMSDATTGCPHLGSFACSSGTTPENAVATGASPYGVTIIYPVSDAMITDTHNGGISAGDGDQCQRLAVKISKTDKAQFAGILGVNSQTNSATAVIRVFTEPSKQQVAALLLLERFECQTLWASGQGNVLVKMFDADNQGRIHADSFATTSSSCNGSNASANRIYGTPIPPSNVAPSGRQGAPQIIAEGTGALCPTSTSGRGFLTLPTLGAHSAQIVDSGVCPGPATGSVSSRSRTDERYNGYNIKTGATSAGNWITQLRNAALTETGRNKAQAAAPPNSYRIFPDDYASSGITDCSPNITTAVGSASDKVFVDCDLTPANLILRGRTIVVRGKIALGSGSTLRLPDAETLYVRGCGSTTAAGDVSGCGGGPAERGIDINNATFSVHDGQVALGDVGTYTCAANADPANKALKSTSRFVVTTGKFYVNNQGSRVRMCGTTLYLAEKPSDASTKDTATTVPSTPQASCVLVAQPCPTTVDSNSVMETAGALDWSAPNIAFSLSTGKAIPACETPTDTTDCYPWFPGQSNANGSYTQYQLEDLAFWSEAGGPGTSTSATGSSEIGGQGFTALSGVFFIPNGLFTFQGQTSLSQQLDAQFIARRLNLNGQGDLVMIPNPANAIKVDELNYSLIR